MFKILLFVFWWLFLLKMKNFAIGRGWETIHGDKLSVLSFKISASGHHSYMRGKTGNCMPTLAYARTLEKNRNHARTYAVKLDRQREKKIAPPRSPLRGVALPPDRRREEKKNWRRMGGGEVSKTDGSSVRGRASTARAAGWLGDGIIFHTQGTH